MLLRRLRGPVVAFGLLLASFAAYGDTVVLKNGDRLTGKIVHKSGDRIVLDTRYAGQIKIRWDDVASVGSDGPLPIMRRGAGTPERVRLRTVEGGGVRVEPARAGEPQQRMALDDIAYINPLPQESGIGTSYGGRVKLSAAVANGNTESDRVYGEAEFTAKAKEHRYAIGGRARRESDGGNLTAQNWRIAGNYDWLTAERRFWYVRSAFENDRFKDIRLRSSVGAGMGLRIFEDPARNLEVRGGLDYVDVDRRMASDEQYPALGWGVKYTHWLFSRTLQFFHDQEGYWNLDDTDRVTLRSRTGLRLPLTAALSADLQLNLDWDREPAPGRKSVDTTWLLGIGYAW